jgi:hypothetical protein
MKHAMLPYPKNGVAFSEESAILSLLSRLLQPVARLCLANGITFAVVAEILKRAFVHEARLLHPDMPEHGMVSRISTATGINRREVTRLTKADIPAAVTRQPPAAEVLARWITDPSLRDRKGKPLALKRTGAGQSFEVLAQLVTRDVHPRSLLDELIRLGLVQHDAAGDQVALVVDDFVPRADLQQMLAFLSDNVGDHLEAAVENVTTGDGRHMEQAIFADELSEESARALQPRITARWQALREELVPFITELIEADRQAGRPQDQRVRIGLYSFTTLDAACKKPKQQKRQRRFRSMTPKEATS